MVRIEASIRSWSRRLRRARRSYRPIEWTFWLVALFVVPYVGIRMIPLGDLWAVPENRVPIIAAFTGGFLTLIGIVIAVRVHRAARHDATNDLAVRFNEGEFSHSHDRIRTVFPLPWDRPLPLDEIEARLGALDPVRHVLIEQDLKRVLNHFDIVAMGYIEGHYEPHMVQHLYGYLLPGYVSYFSPWIARQCELPEEVPLLEAFRQRTGQDADPRATPWWYLLELASEWAEYRGEWAPSSRVTVAVTAPDSTREGSLVRQPSEGGTGKRQP